MIVKETLPLDGEWHLATIGPIRAVVHDPKAKKGLLTFWWDTAYDPVPQRLRAFATDESIPRESSYVGTDVDSSSGEAWHLYKGSDVGVSDV